MSHPIGAAPTDAILIDPDVEGDLATQLKRAFAAAADAAVVIDLHRVAIVGPDFLRALSDGIEAGGEIVLTGVAPEVYKALHVAGLAARLRRR